MNESNAPGLPALRRFCRVACALVVAITVTVFIGGWCLNVPVLLSLVPRTVEMKALSAIGLFFSAVALLLLLDAPVTKRRRAVGSVCAAVPTLLGMAVLGEYVFGWRLGIDELLFRDTIGHAQKIGYPGRFAPTTAVDLVLTGIALLTFEVRSRRGWRVSELLAIPIALVGATSIIGYMYAIPQFYGPASAAKMALSTSVCFTALACGLVLARPHGRLAHLATTDDPGGIMMRRLMPLAIALPILFGWARLKAVDLKVFNDRVATWWLAAVTVAGFAMLIWRVAARLSRYAAERGVLEAELHHLANHDPLTGLLNRRRFDAELLQAVATANRYGHASSLLMVDLDRMKEVNDEHGHKAGDDLLQAVAAIFSDRLRTTDCAARLGGDEFGVLLPNTDLAGAAIVAESLRKCIAESCAPSATTPWTTASIGLARISGGYDTVDAVMAAADRAMYYAKGLGGDSVATDPDADPATQAFPLVGADL